MNAARRNLKRRDWPRGLYESKPGYYIWRSKATGKALAIGAVSLAVAKAQANEANDYEAGTASRLVERIVGADNTVGELLDIMPAAETANTIKTWKSLDKIIRAKLGHVRCGRLTVKQCATAIREIVGEGKARSAEAVRTRLIQVCKHGMGEGWMTGNPAEATNPPKVVVKRGRLTMSSFRAIYEAAPRVSTWLQRAMMIGLVLGADRITIAGLQRTNVAGGLLTYQRQKTQRWIAVPLALRMDAVGVSLDDLVGQRGKVLSPYLLHHTRPQGQAKVGAPIHPDTISQAFTDARKLAEIPDEKAPTFHELRSLCKREYDRQGGVDTKALLGHAGERVSDLYADARGVEPVRVKVG